MNWKQIESEADLEDIVSLSKAKPQVIFKHSTRCSISKMALNRLERSDVFQGADFHLLDLLHYRTLSNKIADDFKIEHESPQILIINQGKCIFDASHSAISMEDIIEHIHAGAN
ncbi:MAG: bacillithiol system redox-active protein YtxJ [Ferruginibacter sp.]|nr:bacillithiol system redox-active protein YtxJ [Ferruginibacter sp.]